MASTDKVLGRISTWSTVAVLLGFVALPFLPGRHTVPAHSEPAKAPVRPQAHHDVAAPARVVAMAETATAETAKVETAKEPPTAPTSEPAPAKPPEDVWTEAQLAEGLRECLRLLSPINVEVTLEEPMKHGQCGTPAPLLLHSIGEASKVVFDPAPEMNCRLAAGLARWVDTVLQPTAREVLGSRITRIIGASSYACRNMYSNPKLPLSEHATGNAVDIAGFVTADGRTVTVTKGWGPTERDIAEAKKRIAEAAKSGAGDAKTADSKEKPEAAAEDKTGKKSAREKTNVHKAGFGGDKGHNGLHAPVVAATANLSAAKTTEAAFLRRLHHGACSMFTTVLGPEANEAHHDHLHFDMKERKGRPICH